MNSLEVMKKEVSSVKISEGLKKMKLLGWAPLIKRSYLQTVPKADTAFLHTVAEIFCMLLADWISQGKPMYLLIFNNLHTVFLLGSSRLHLLDL